MTELYINSNWIEVEDVKLIRQISSFGQLEAKTNISNKFKILWTKENAEIFEWITTIQSNSLLPYIEIPVKLRRNKNYLIQNGKAVITDSNASEIDLIVMDGNIDFFTKIKGKSLTDLDLSALDFTWDLDYAEDNRAATDMPVFLLFSFGLGKLDIAHMLPFIPINLLVDQILLESGFTGSGDLLSLADYTDLWISLVDSRPNAENLQILAKAEDTIKVITLAHPEEDITLIGVEFSTWENNVYITTLTRPHIGDVTAYQVLYTGVYSFKVQVKITSNEEGGNHNYIHVVWTGNNQSTELAAGLADYEETFTDQTLTAGDYIYMYVEKDIDNSLTVWNSDIPENPTGYIEITAAPELELGLYNTIYNVSNNLPPFLQSDLINFICKLFNARIIVQGTTVKFQLYSEVETKIKQGIYIDWSSKHFTNIKVKYQSEYGQKNIIKYSNTDINKGYFNISDPQLKEINTIFTFPVEYVENFAMYKITEDSATLESFEFSHLGKATIKKRSLDTGSETIFADGYIDTPIELTTNIPNVEDVNLQEYIDTYYSFMSKTLNMYREIKADVYLTVNDYNALDFEKPIWIKNWGWFLLNDVVFREGESTVNMVHINKSSYVPDIAGAGDYDGRDYNLEFDYY